MSLEATSASSLAAEEHPGVAFAEEGLREVRKVGCLKWQNSNVSWVRNTSLGDQVCCSCVFREDNEQKIP